MPGPPPKPIEQKRAQGNPGHQKLEPMAVIEGSIERIPEPPEHLGAAGRHRWVQVWGTADKWLVPATDVGLLVRYCEGFDQRVYWTGLIKREGRMSRGSTGQPKVHPAVEELGKLDDRLTRWESELGFTPTGRARLHIERKPKAPERKLDKYLTG